MNIWKKNKNKHKDISFSNNRINVVMAIVFLLGSIVIYRLYELQVNKFDLYTALASGQHQISSQLMPSRGNIYINDYSGQEKNLFPLATNKDFALVYAVPKDVESKEEAEKISEILYQAFKKESVEKEVEELLEKQEEDKRAEELNFVSSLPAEERAVKESEISQKYETLEYNKEYQEFKQIKREKEIELRKDKIISEYLDMLTKEGDPYEPIEMKVDTEQLKNLYAQFLSSASQEVSADELELKNEKMLYNSEEVEWPGVGFAIKSYRYYPEANIGSHILGFVRHTEEEQRGNYGLEGFFDGELFGQYGSIKSEKSADGNVIIVNDREYVQPMNGSDFVLTIDRSVEYTVCEKLKKAVEYNDADSGSVVIMNPKTGEIIAMCAYPDFDPNKYEEVDSINVFNNPVVFSQYEPGSIFKAITIAIGLDQGKITPDSTFDDTGVFKIADYEIRNSDKKAHGVVNMTQVLEESLNTGAIDVMQKVGVEKFLDYVIDFGFSEKTGIELEGENKGDIRNLVESKSNIERELYSATASFGQGVSVTPIQTVTAFSAIANGGILMKPYIVKEIIKPNGEKIETKPIEVRRVISERASTLLGGMLVEVVENG
ncbi:penicillin-binding protein 2, partial [Patescibacteria group bacterium]|nr:penicillin-binding protein 2 [Patescibacteria group bacterium]